MRIIKNCLFLFPALITLSCSTRNDRVLSASDELHSIILYEKGNDFDLLYNGINTAIGKYSFKGDTILLVYHQTQFEEFDPNKMLPRKIWIDTKSKSVRSIDDGKQFCARIDLDKRDKN